MRLIGRTGSRDGGDAASTLGSAIAFFALVGATGCVQAASVPASSRSPAPDPSPASAAVAPPSQRAPEAAAEALAPTGAPRAVDEDVDDDLDLPSAGGGPTPTPYDAMSDAEIEEKLRADPAALGSMSVGRPNAGVLVGGVPMPEGPAWEIVSSAGAWGTKETVDALIHCIQVVNARFPDSPKAYIGHLSARRGGPLRPHVSHQSGRDVDVSYYLRGDAHRWYATATEGILDLDRTWTFVRALVTDTDVEYVFMDRSVQTLLRDHALRIGEDPGFVDSIFQVGDKSVRPIFFHVKGHLTHLHVRFYNPAAQELGRRAYQLLLRRGIVQPPTWFVTHTVKPGETLSHIALRYKTTVEALLKPNHLTETSIIKINSVVRIPMKGGIAAAPRLALPARRTPRGPAPSPTATGFTAAVGRSNVE